jgi:hypothetical protein
MSTRTPLHITALMLALLFSFGIFSACRAATITKLPAMAPQPAVVSPQGHTSYLYTESHALLISASNYLGAARQGWRPLENTAREMDQVAAALQLHGFNVWRVSDPTGDELHDIFRNFIADYGHDKNVRLIFFFSGHGYTNPNNGFGYLVPVDAKDPSVFRRDFYVKALPIEQLRLWAREIEARHALFLFDSCFSGSIFGARSLARPIERGRTPSERWRFFITGQSAKPVRQFIAAGSANEMLPARSKFASMVIEALTDGKASKVGDGYMTGRELGLWIEQTLPTFVRSQNPHSDVLNELEWSFGDMVFQVTPALRLEAAPVDSNRPNYRSLEIRKTLDELIDLVGIDDLDTIAIMGFDNSEQNERASTRLAIGHADEIKAYFVSKGIEKNRIYTAGKGSSRNLSMPMSHVEIQIVPRSLEGKVRKVGPQLIISPNAYIAGAPAR